MSMTATILALAGGIAARIAKPSREVNADVEITRLKAELAEAQRQLHVMRLAFMDERQPRPQVAINGTLHEVIDCTGGGRYSYLMHPAGLQQQMAARQNFLAQQAFGMQQAQQNQFDQFALYTQALNAFSRNVVTEGE